jgi:hypothetical protein
LPRSNTPSVLRVPTAGLLAWLIPGMGHVYLGFRRRGLILLVTITLTFWMGVAIGGVRGTVDPNNRRAWFVAELCAGVNTIAALYIHNSLGMVPKAEPNRSGTQAYVGHWLSVDVGIHYAGVAGLLNVLVILDAVARADPALAGLRRKRPSAEAAP